jgi:hypothetical protein
MGRPAFSFGSMFSGLSEFGQVQLKAADVIRGGRVRRPLENCRKPFAAMDVASLRVRTELARVYVLDHELTQ